MQFKILWNALAVICILAGCTRVESHVSLSSIITPEHLSKRVAVVGYPESANRSLLFRTKLKSPVEKALASKGFRIVSEDSKPDLIAFVSYGIDTGTEVTNTTSVPVYGQTGGGVAHHSGTVYGAGRTARYSGTSYSMPTYGIVGSRTKSSRSTLFTRRLAIDLVTASSAETLNPKKVLEGRVISKGSCGVIEEVFEEMVTALFQKFPSGSGKVRIFKEGRC